MENNIPKNNLPNIELLLARLSQKDDYIYELKRELEEAVCLVKQFKDLSTENEKVIKAFDSLHFLRYYPEHDGTDLAFRVMTFINDEPKEIGDGLTPLLALMNLKSTKRYDKKNN